MKSFKFQQKRTKNNKRLQIGLKSSTIIIFIYFDQYNSIKSSNKSQVKSERHTHDSKRTCGAPKYAGISVHTSVHGCGIRRV